MLTAKRTLRIRDDVGKPLRTGETTGDYDYDRVLYECHECGRVHYVALECPPANAKTVEYKGRRRVVESVD